MLPEVELDVLHSLDRTSLEGLQTHSRYLRDLVNRHAGTLPLRQIHKVSTRVDTAYIHLVEVRPDCVKARASGEGELDVLFRRVNNAFIHRLDISFRPKSLPLLRYLRDKGDELQCQVKTLFIEAVDVDVDYTLVDFIGIRLKPQVYETCMNRFRQDYAMLFTRTAMRGSVKHLEYDVDTSPAPDCILPELFGVDVVETCAVASEVDPRMWICKFIEKFEMAERGVNIVRSVTLHHVRSAESPLRHAVDPLGRPLRTKVPTPNCSFINEWSRDGLLQGFTITESTFAELFVVENAKAAKKLEVFEWTVDEECEDENEKCLHYAFLLRCR